MPVPLPPCICSTGCGRIWVNTGQLTLPWVGTSLTTYQTLFLAGLGLELMMLPLVWWMRPGLEVSDEGVKIIAAPPKAAGANWLDTLSSSVRNSARNTVRLFGGLFQQTGFYRLLAFLLLIAFLKLIFMQMNYVFPEFGIRELGEGAPVGKLWAINSLLVILLVPVIGALTQRFRRTAWWRWAAPFPRRRSSS